MKRFGYLVTGMIISCSIVILTAIELGRLKPFPTPTASLFAKPDGSLCQELCVVGIQPDQGDMFSTMKTLPVLKQLESSTFDSPGDHVVSYQANAIKIQGSEAHQWIEVQLRTNFRFGNPPSLYPLPQALQGNVSLADFIAIFGSPDYLIARPFQGNWAVNMFFRRDRYGALVIILSSGERLDMRAEVSYVSVNMASSFSFDNSSLHNWQGFISNERYQ